MPHAGSSLCHADHLFQRQPPCVVHGLSCSMASEISVAKPGIKHPSTARRSQPLDRQGIPHILGYVYVFFWRNVYSTLLSIFKINLIRFFFFFLSYRCSLYILEMKSLSDIRFATILFHSKGDLFHSIDCSLCCVESF